MFENNELIGWIEMEQLATACEREGLGWSVISDLINPNFENAQGALPVLMRFKFEQGALRINEVQIRKCIYVVFI